MAKDDVNDPGQKFLRDFLSQLMALQRTNQELVQVMLKTYQQQQQILTQQASLTQQIGNMTAHLDGLSQRADYLYERMGELGSILIDEQQPQSQTYYPTQPTHYAPNPIEQIGGAVANTLFGAGATQRRSGRRRRR